jgi:calcium/calmodulin-dependent protein kinase I
MLGSPIYMSPEIVKNEIYDKKVDVWSAGVVAYVLITGQPPFHAKDKEDLYKAIKTEEINYLLS